MSARRLQQPRTLSALGCRCVGTTIVTTLAVLPETTHVSEVLVGSPDAPSTSLRRSNSVQRRFRGFLSNAYRTLSCTRGAEERNPFHPKLPVAPAVEAFQSGRPDQLLNVQRVIADFKAPHVPAFLRADLMINRPNVAAVREVLDAYTNGSWNETLIEAKFPDGDFQQHLFAYLRWSMAAYKEVDAKSVDAKLLDLYITGVKEWCAAAHDLFIRSMDLPVRVDAATNDPAKLKIQGETEMHFRGQAAGRQDVVVQSLAKNVFERCPDLCSRWHTYKRRRKLTNKVFPSKLMLDAGFPTNTLRKNLHFISWVLRFCSPQMFMAASRLIAEAVREAGGPSFLVNALDLKYLHEVDIAEYEQWRELFRSDVEEDISMATVKKGPSKPLLTSTTLPMVKDHLDDPLRILDPVKVLQDFSQSELPPFLQLGAGIERPNTQASIKAVHLYSEENHQSLSHLMEETFSDEQLHTHLFSYFRDVMRSYNFLPDRPKHFKNPQFWYPHNLDNPPGKLLRAYIQGLQRWCADAHDAFSREVEIALECSAEQIGDRDYIEAVQAVQPMYTSIVNCMKCQTKPEVLADLPPPPERPAEIDPQIAKLKDSLYESNWLIRNMPWDCFLFLRLEMARAVKQLDNGEKGFLFLSNVLESLSFTDRDAGEFKNYFDKYCQRSTSL